MTLIDPEKPIRPMVFGLRHDLSLFAAREWVTIEEAAKAVAYFATYQRRNHRQWWARRERPNAADVQAAKRRYEASFGGKESYRIFMHMTRDHRRELAAARVQPPRR
ncbi:MAG: hypothetical protein Q8Q09_19195 [Deltaproteobacteria bacterium]|nr:hypothetical protein [Deltaproteobacteria bacterium]